LDIIDGPFVEPLSSPTRLRILDLLSKRPRTLRELAKLTGISVQGVDRHLENLRKMGVLKEREIRSDELSARKEYYLEGAHFSDFSVGDLAIVKASRARRPELTRGFSGNELESFASDISIRRRQIKERAKRLARMIDELSEDELRLVAMIDAMGLNNEERLIVETVFTEETLQDAKDLLTKVQGLPASTRSIEKALSKARQIVVK
jgi:DNA-binding transcriptional ArsR family regulator